jgi:hypothetical protein
MARVEDRLTSLLRSPATRTAGLVLGLIAVVALVARVMQDGDAALAAVREIGVGGIGLALLSMTAWQVAPIVAAARFGTPDAAGVWARAQLLKYIPVPASAVAGFVGSSVRAGSGTRDAVGTMVRQTGALVLGAATLGVWSVFQWSLSVDPRLGPVVLAVAGVGLGAAWVAALRDSRWRPATLVSLAGWAVAAAGLGLGLGQEHALLVGSAVLASWVVGQAIVPVPAGIGVRELTLIVLVQHAIGVDAAVVVALLARLVHTAADVLMAAAVLGFERWRQPQLGP